MANEYTNLERNRLEKLERLRAEKSHPPPQHRDPHCLMTLKVNLRSNCSRKTPRQARRPSSEPYKVKAHPTRSRPRCVRCRCAADEIVPMPTDRCPSAVEVGGAQLDFVADLVAQHGFGGLELDGLVGAHAPAVLEQRHAEDPHLVERVAVLALVAAHAVNEGLFEYQDQVVQELGPVERISAQLHTSGRLLLDCPTQRPDKRRPGQNSLGTGQNDGNERDACFG